MQLHELTLDQLYERLNQNTTARGDVLERLDELDLERMVLIATIANVQAPRPEPETKTVTVEVEKPCEVCKKRSRGQVDLFKFEA